jgi:flagellar assembly protein FliH
MTTIQKFLFDRSFDDEVLVRETPVEETEGGEVVEEEEEPEEPIITFTEEEMETARAESHAAGHAEGVREASDAIERQAAEALSEIAKLLPTIFAAQEEANAIKSRDAITVAVAIVRKLFPELNRQNGMEEVERVIELTLGTLSDESKVTIRVGDDMRDVVAGRIDALTADAGYEGKVLVLGDPDQAPGSCRVEWSDGGAERDTDAMWQEIDTIIARNVGSGSPETPPPTPDE